MDACACLDAAQPYATSGLSIYCKLDVQMVIDRTDETTFHSLIVQTLLVICSSLVTYPDSQLEVLRSRFFHRIVHAMLLMRTSKLELVLKRCLNLW